MEEAEGLCDRIGTLKSPVYTHCRTRAKKSTVFRGHLFGCRGYVMAEETYSSQIYEADIPVFPAVYANN